MIRNSSGLLDRFKEDRTFWIVVGSLLLLYLMLQLRAVLPFLFTIVWLLLAITVHEFAHAWSADQLGDPTARYAGRLSLNPIVHLDPMGTVMMVLTALTGFGIGWGKPVPVSSHRLRYGRRKGNALVALSGPTANILFGIAMGLLYRLVSAQFSLPWLLHEAFSGLVMINLIIAFFNLIPLPPLDGHSVLVGLLSLSNAAWIHGIIRRLEQLEQYGAILLFALIILSQFSGLNLLGWCIGRPAMYLYQIIMGIG